MHCSFGSFIFFCTLACFVCLSYRCLSYLYSFLIFAQPCFLSVCRSFIHVKKSTSSSVFIRHNFWKSARQDREKWGELEEKNWNWNVTWRKQVRLHSFPHPSVPYNPSQGVGQCYWVVNDWLAKKCASRRWCHVSKNQKQHANMSDFCLNWGEWMAGKTARPKAPWNIAPSQQVTDAAKLWHIAKGWIIHAEYGNIMKVPCAPIPTPSRSLLFFKY